MDAIDNLSLDFTAYFTPMIALLISLFIGLWVKDWLFNLMNGLKFKMDPSFNEGDRCIIDGQCFLYSMGEGTYGGMCQTKELNS